MTTEAIAGKLMWILGQTRAPETIHRLFYTPVANDILNYHILIRLLGPIFSPRKRKDRGEKECVETRLVRAASEFRRGPMFQASFHTIVTSQVSYYAPLDTGVSDL